MNHRLVMLLALGSVSACAVLFTACGGDDSTTGDGGNDATSGNDVVNNNDTGSNNDTGTNDTGTNDTGTNDTGTTDGGCAPGPGCRQCCATAFPDAAAFFTAQEETCACTTPGDCKAQNVCGGTLCKGNQPSGGCQTCLNDKDSGDCFNTAAAACLGNVGCQPLAACVVACGAIADAGGGG